MYIYIYNPTANIVNTIWLKKAVLERFEGCWKHVDQLYWPFQLKLMIHLTGELWGCNIGIVVVCCCCMTRSLIIYCTYLVCHDAAMTPIERWFLPSSISWRSNLTIVDCKGFDLIPDPQDDWFRYGQSANMPGTAWALQKVGRISIWSLDISWYIKITWKILNTKQNMFLFNFGFQILVHFVWPTKWLKTRSFSVTPRHARWPFSALARRASSPSIPAPGPRPSATPEWMEVVR